MMFGVMQFDLVHLANPCRCRYLYNSTFHAMLEPQTFRLPKMLSSHLNRSHLQEAALGIAALLGLPPDYHRFPDRHNLQEH